MQHINCQVVDIVSDTPTSSQPLEHLPNTRVQLTLLYLKDQVV